MDGDADDRLICNHYEVDPSSSSLPVFTMDEGPSSERGEQLGERSRAHVHHSLSLYRAVIPALTGRSWSELIDLAVPMIAASRSFDPALVDELEGVAAGAGASFDDIAVLCARSELLHLGNAAPVGECTSVVEHGRIGQTWDWFVSQLDACVVWRTPRFVAFAEGGMPPKIGVNTNGVAVTLNFLSTTLPVDPGGLPVHIVLHHLLERATSTSDAVERLLAAPSAACAAIGLLDPTGAAAVVEMAPHGKSAVAHGAVTGDATAPSPAHIRTNHCLSEALSGLDVPGLLLVNSIARLSRARQLQDEGVSMEALLADDDGGWHPIALAADPAAPLESQLGTVTGVIIDVHQRTLLIAPGNPSVVGFTQLVALETSAP
jgi:isopenicillin-N N-acyltransferase like protein